MGTFEIDEVSGKITVRGTVTWPSTALVTATGHSFNVTLVSTVRDGDEELGMAVAQVLGSIMQVHDEELDPDIKRLRGVMYAPDRGPGHPWVSPTSFGIKCGFEHPFPIVSADGTVSDFRGEQRFFSMYVPALHRFVGGFRNLLMKTSVGVIVRPGHLSIKSEENKDERSRLMQAIAQHETRVHLELGTSADVYALSGVNVRRVSTALPTGYITSTSIDRVKEFEEYIAAYQIAVETSEIELDYTATFARTRKGPHICGGD